jgi:hypothetical protein
VAQRGKEKMSDYSEARKLVKPQKVLSYENLYASLPCGHRVYFWRRNGKAPKKLLCPKCISAIAAQQMREPDSLKAGVLSLPDVVKVESNLPA